MTKLFFPLVVALALVSPAAAQTPLDSYVAVIGPEDARNSSGNALTEPGQILAQDRANYHRFGVRQDGDAGDTIFSDRAMRSELPALFGRGETSPEAVAALLSANGQTVLVEVYGTSGRPTHVDVTLVGQGNTAPDSPSPAVAGGASVRTNKDVFAEGEAIVVEFGAPAPKKRYRVAFAPVGSPPRTGYDGVYIDGRTSGEVQMPGQKPGRHEVRLMDGWDLVARHEFAVGNSCFDAKVGETRLCAPAVGTEKSEYAVDEPIKIMFEGAPGTNLDFVSVVVRNADGTFGTPEGGPARFGNVGAPDGQFKPWARLSGKMAGEVIVYGVGPGDYEVWLHSRFPGYDKPIARSAFKAGDFASSITPEVAEEGKDNDKVDSPIKRLPEPGYDGSWIGFFTCNDGQRAGRNRAPPFVGFLDIAGSERTVSADFFLLMNAVEGLSVKMEGAFDSSSGALSLAPTEWIYQPRNPETKPFDLKIRIADSGLEFNATGGDCTEIAGYKYIKDTRPAAPDGLISIMKDYDTKFLTGDICVSFLKWISDGTTVQALGQNVPTQLLDGDRFFEVLGKPYDQWTLNDRLASNAIWNGCVQKSQGSASIEASSALGDAMRTSSFRDYLGVSLPSGPSPDNSRLHFGFLSNYAAVVAVRNARLYADEQLVAASAMPDTEESWKAIAAGAGKITTGAGLFAVLSTDERNSIAGKLKERQTQIAETLLNDAFAKFSPAEYAVELSGLKQAVADRGVIEGWAQTYGSQAQLADLGRRFDEALAPLSGEVADQTVASMTPLPERVEGLLAGVEEKAQASREILTYLLPADARTVASAFEERNVALIGRIGSGLAEELGTFVTPDDQGRETLAKLSKEIFGISLGDLAAAGPKPPYDVVSAALLDRNELLKYQICSLPPGFEELKPLICLEAVQ